MREKIALYTAGSKKGYELIQKLQNSDGSFAKTEHMVFGHYKAPISLSTAGYKKEAEMSLDYIVDRFMEDWDFNKGFCDVSMPLLDNYRNAWIIWGAHVLGRKDVWEPATDYLESCLHPHLGGMPGRKEYHPVESIMDWATSALCAVAFTHVGRLDAARSCCQFLEGMLDSQPEPDDRLYLRKTVDGKIIHFFPPAMSTDFKIEFKQPNQLVWYFGAGMAAFGYLYEKTKEDHYLKQAQRIFNLTKKCHPEVYTVLSSGKIGWGTCVLYSVTGDQAYKDIMLTVGNHLIRTQTDEGGWVRYPLFTSWAAQPPVFGIEATHERSMWLHMMADVLTDK
jgi:hypothetical protein